VRWSADGAATRERLPIVSSDLPPSIADEVAVWPEFRMGVHRVQVELADGRRFDDVMVAGARVVKVLGRDDVPFDASAVVAAIDRSNAPLPPGY
jgi:hypothetical protein